MRENRGRERKRGRKEPRDRKVFSRVLREIGTAIQRRGFEAALSRVNEQLKRRLGDAEAEARLLGLVGDSEYKRGAFDKAAGVYLKSAQKGMGHPVWWWRGLLGCVRALVKVPDMQRAAVMARHALEVARQKNAEYREGIRQADEELRKRGVVRVPQKPPRVSVVATRLGKLFLNEGELALAEEFLSAACADNPGGACRARIELARIVLGRGQASDAVRMVEEALRRGQFQAKTVSGWSVLIEARRKAGGWQIKERLLDGLKKSPARVRGRATVLIVQELKRRDMRQWREVAERWLGDPAENDPVIEAELRKIMLAAARMENRDAEERQRLAEELMKVSKLHPIEWLAAGRVWAEAVWARGGQPAVEDLLRRTEQRYGVEWKWRVQHSLALTSMNMRRHDEARELLSDVIHNSRGHRELWGKAVWALARMEKALGNWAEAAAGFRAYAEEEGMPIRLRLQARLQWAEALAAAGDRKALMTAQPELQAMLNEVTNPLLLLDIARLLLGVRDARWEAWASELYERGSRQAYEQFAAASHPSVAVDILFKLTRRQVCDFAQFEEAIEFWESMPESKRAWLWSEKEAFWEYLGWLFEAYEKAGREEEAAVWAEQWLGDEATPPFGWVHIGIRYGRWLLRRARLKEALEWFDRVVEKAPYHSFCGLAWYWKALRAHKDGAIADRDRYVSNLRTAQGERPGLWYEWALDAKAWLLSTSLDERKAESVVGRYSEADWRRLKKEIEQEMRMLP